MTTQDHKRLAACLTELMTAESTSRDVASIAEMLADQLATFPEPNQKLINQAQLLLERHNCRCDDGPAA